MDKSTEIEFHPIANIFPIIKDERLEDSLKENGYDPTEPITLYEEKILDGRNRYLACMACGIEPICREFDSSWLVSGNPVEWVISKNITRRHLKPHEIAWAIAQSKELIEEERLKARKRGDRKRSEQAMERSRDDSGLFIQSPEVFQATGVGETLQQVTGGKKRKAGHRGEAFDEIAQAFGGQVSARSLYQAVQIRDSGIPEIIERSQKGKISLENASELVGAINGTSQTKPRMSRDDLNYIFDPNVSQDIQRRRVSETVKEIKGRRPSIKRPSRKSGKRRPGVTTLINTFQQAKPGDQKDFLQWLCDNHYLMKVNQHVST